MTLTNSHHTEKVENPLNYLRQLSEQGSIEAYCILGLLGRVHALEEIIQDLQQDIFNLENKHSNKEITQ